MLSALVFALGSAELSQKKPAEKRRRGKGKGGHSTITTGEAGAFLRTLSIPFLQEALAL